MSSRSFFCRVRDAFSVFARKSSHLLGSAWSFVAAIVVIVLWAATGPAFHYSDTWQLIINTGASIDDADGFPDPEHAEPGRQGDASKARGADTIA